jgi:Fe2+ or Zn2+ uptake regulation protein
LWPSYIPAGKVKWVTEKTGILTEIQDEEVVVAERGVPPTKHHHLVTDQCGRVAAKI